MTHLSRRHMMFASALAPFLRGSTLQQVHLSITSDEIDEDLRAAAVFIQRHGLGYAELRSIWGKYNTTYPLDKIREAKAVLDEHQLKTAIVDTTFFRGALPPEGPQEKSALDEQWALLDDAMARAKILGVDKLRTFAFTYKSGESPDPTQYPRI